ncbi:MAG: hypothetical protein AAF802_00165 [Planctomycetota bacterium]
MTSWFKPCVAAFAFALLTVGAIYLLPGVDATLGHFIVLLIIPGVYVGMAIAEGSGRKIVVETIVAFSFVVIAAVGFQYSPMLIGVGLLLHGVWDLLHHRGWLELNTGEFYPPFCAAYDFLVGSAFILYQWLS